jgi:regulator of protease activity HflC (stomatin/prohibitin superfamily)
MLNFGLGFLALIIVLAIASIRILREYERGVVFLLGRFQRVMGPGLIIVVPGVQQMVRVDLRLVVLDVPSQDVISRDNVSVKVNAVVYFRVVDPQLAIIQVANFLDATSQLAQTTLRSVLGKHELDEMLAERDKLNASRLEPGSREWTPARPGMNFLRCFLPSSNPPKDVEKGQREESHHHQGSHQVRLLLRRQGSARRDGYH